MDVDLEAPSGGGGGGGEGSEETLILKFGGKDEEEAGAHGEGVETELSGDMDVVGGGERVVEDKAGDGGQERESGVGEKEAVTSDVVDEKRSRDVDDDDLLEDVDVDIDDSGDLRTRMLIRCGHDAVDVGGNEVGNGRRNAEDTTSTDKLEKENEMAVEGVGANISEDISGKVDKMEQDDAIGEPVSGKSSVALHPGGRTVGNVAGESEDEEVDIGGDREPNMFTNPSITTDANVRSEPTENVLHVSYQLAAGKEGGFSVSDMVWGKVRSHPWWPGQIFDPSKASEIAMKHHKKEKYCYLVAFFGDRTFAWSEASQLKHFRAHFPHVEKQSGSEALHHAISCALEEVSRRVELGLACKCIQSDVYESLRYQNVENTGIQEEVSRIESTDESASVYLFEPRNFLQYVKSVAQNPSNGADQLEIVIAKSQLLAFNRLKGYYHLPEYQFIELSPNSNSETVTYSSFTDEGRNQIDTSFKRKHNTMDIVYTSKRERNMDESMLLMGENYEDDENIHGSSGSLLSGKRQNTGGAPKQSFKIGDCIVRAASQLTGSPGPSSFLRSINEKYQKVSENNGASRDVHAQHENHNINSSSSIADDVLPQPQSVAHGRMKEPSANNLGNTSSSPDNAGDGRNAKAPESVKGSSEAFEFEEMKDSYWTDRAIQNGGEEKPERKLNYQAVTLQPPVSFSRTPRVHSRRRYSNGSHKIAAERPMSAVDKSKQDMLPAELILNFPDMNSIPSEGKLNNMYRRFGPLREFETEVDRDSNRARVVFKRASDAEVAYSSCEKFNIFGSSVVRYELSYTPSVSYKAARLQSTQGMETDTLREIDFASSAHDLEFITMQELEDATMQDLQYPHQHDLEGVTMQDLEFETTHDLEFPGSQDLDTVPTHPSEAVSINLDVSAEDQHPATLEMPSSGHLEFEAGENMTDGFSAAPQDMEIAKAEDQQPTNQDLMIKTLEDLKSGQVHQIEAVRVQQVEHIMNPETADEPTSVDTRGAVAMEISAQDTNNLLAQDTEVTATEDPDVTTSGEEILAKEQDPVSADQVNQGTGSNDNGTTADLTTLQEPEGGTDDPMILTDQIAEQEDNLENDTDLSNGNADQETNLENASMAVGESQVASVEDDPLEIEMQAPDVEKIEQDPVEIDATRDSVPATTEDAATETVVTSAGASETEVTKVPATVISNTGDDVSVVAEDTEVETTEQDELQVAPDYAKEASDVEVTHDDNVEIVNTQLLEPQTEDSTDAGNVVSGVTNAQKNPEDATEETGEKVWRTEDSKTDEQKVVASTTNEKLQEVA